jgi:hypothetical protein
MVTFRDGDRFRAWYRVDAAAFGQQKRRAMTAYAESDDGVHWRKPKLGLIEFDGNKDNNLVWDGGPGNLAPFRDDNPDCKPDERYKAVARSRDLHALVSPDGLRLKLIEKDPISNDRPPRRGMDTRFFKGMRWVRRTTSKDFRNWTPPEPIQTGDAPREEFYANATIRYARVPDYLLMFPSRFASAREPIPGWKYGKGVNDIAFLSSRDGVHFDRTFLEAFIRPGLDQGNWHERSLYMERGILQTSPIELSLYCMQNWRLPTVQIRRYTLRPDGFVSVQGPYQGGELITRPLKFSGSELQLNYSTSAVGSIRIELQDSDRQPIPGFALDDCVELYGDKLDGSIRWKGDADLSSLDGRTLRMRIGLSDADLYAFRFADVNQRTALLTPALSLVGVKR